MPVGLPLPKRDELSPVAGLDLFSVSAGIRKSGRRDLLLMRLVEGSTVAGVFTQNAFCAAPVQVCRGHLASGGPIRALLINTGCANAGTGAAGLEDARTSCAWVAEVCGLHPSQVLPFSTGVILERLPMERLRAGIELASCSGPSDWLDAAHSIMTTDTQPKAISRRVRLSTGQITITGISKGAGMIRPNMATMLGFVATDARLSREDLHGLLLSSVDDSFNAITVDGDTSTNDSLIGIATGASGLDVSRGTADWETFAAEWLAVCQDLAQAIVRDGEGATKFMTIDVVGATSRVEARQVAYAVAHSPLVKTAFFASDPNLGRILAAIGYSGVEGLDVSKVSVELNGVLVAERGGRATSYREEDGQSVMKEEEIKVRIALGRGASQARVWTCDLSHDYVSINADYRS